MSVRAHIDELKKRHQSLSEKVEAVQRTPGSSDAEIAELKKQKMKLKEEIERLSAV